jgi:hypothetical protein
MSIETIKSSTETISSLSEVSFTNSPKCILETLLRQWYDINEALSQLINPLEGAGIVDSHLSDALEACIGAFLTKLKSVSVSKGDNQGAGYLYQQCCQGLYDISNKILGAQLCTQRNYYDVIISDYQSDIRQAVINIIRRHDSSCFVLMGAPVGPQADHAKHLKKILDGTQFESKMSEASLNKKVNIGITETKSITDIVSEHRLPVLFFTPKETKGFRELTQAIQAQQQSAIHVERLEQASPFN